MTTQKVIQSAPCGIDAILAGNCTYLGGHRYYKFILPVFSQQRSASTIVMSVITWKWRIIVESESRIEGGEYGDVFEKHENANVVM